MDKLSLTTSKLRPLSQDDSYSVGRLTLLLPALLSTFKSWYSFIIITLAEAVYMFSFANLIPQLIINYKLKSVSHLP